MTLYSTAKSHFSAAHRGDDGRLHGHTWVVRLEWEYNDEDATDVKAELCKFITKRFDHKDLGSEAAARAEKIATLIAAHMGEFVVVSAVYIDRDVEGLGVIYRR